MARTGRLIYRNQICSKERGKNNEVQKYVFSDSDRTNDSKNRFVVPPMGNNFANTDGTWSDESVAYYAERAKGQFGLITIEATVVHKGAKGGPRKPCLYDDNSIESLKKITDACHAEGAKISIQLQNAGPKEMPRMREHQSRQQQLLQRLMEETFRKQFYRAGI